MSAFGYPGWLRTSDVEKYERIQRTRTLQSLDKTSEEYRTGMRHIQKEEDEAMAKFEEAADILNRPSSQTAGPPDSMSPRHSRKRKATEPESARSKLQKIEHYLPEPEKHILSYDDARVLCDTGIDRVASSTNQISAGGYLDTVHGDQREKLDMARRNIKRHGAFLMANSMGPARTSVVVALAIEVLNEAGAKRLGPVQIIAPPSALKDWERELKQAKLLGQIKYLRLGGAGDYTIQQLAEVDVVLTPYEAVESEYMALKSVQRDWLLVQRGLKWLVEAAERRETPPEKVKDGKWKLATERVEKASLVAGEWEMVILDEAHTIGDLDSITGYAVSSIEARYRGCVSKASSLDDHSIAFAILRFLRVQPCEEKVFRASHKFATAAKPDCKVGLEGDLGLLLSAILFGISGHSVTSADSSLCRITNVIGPAGDRSHAVRDSATLKMQADRMRAWTREQFIAVMTGSSSAGKALSS